MAGRHSFLKAPPINERADGMSLRPTANFASQCWRVEIVQKGRCGELVYHEGSEVASFPWEFGGSDVVVIIFGGSASEWDRKYPWAADRRREILERVASEAIRQKANSCTASFDEKSGDVLLRERK